MTSGTADSRLAQLSPAYFGLVMATGIVSLAADGQGWSTLAHALLWVNALAYVLLWLLTLARAWRYPQALIADVCSHQRAPGFWTIIAATSVLGTQCVVLLGAMQLALALLLCASVLWLILIYGILAVLTVKADKPTLGQGIDGGWLLAVVASQSLVVLSAALLPQLGTAAASLAFAALALWLAAGMLYLWLITLIFYRYLFWPLPAAELTPPYWINMGAMAISTLAGTALYSAAGDSALLKSLRPVLQGVTLLYWAAGSWWIPLLLILGVWRYGVQRIPLRYGPAYWAVVFPLGMYAAATQHVAQTWTLPFLLPIAWGFAVAAVLAWGTTLIGWAHQQLSLLLRPVQA